MAYVSLHNGGAYHGAMADTPRSVANATPSRRALVANAPRRKPGRGSQVTPTERLEMQRLFLVDGLTKTAIAQKTGRTRETVGGVLAGADFDRLKTQIESEIFDEARRILKGNVVRAAKAWPRAIDTAAEKGNHKPAKDLLIHTGVIEPIGESGAQGALVLVGVNIYQDMGTGQRFHGEPPPNRPVAICMTPGLAQEYREAGLPQPFQPPSQEAIDAEAARQEALRAPQSARHAGRTTDIAASVPKPDTPSD